MSQLLLDIAPDARPSLEGFVPGRNAELASRVPVVVYVAPSGSRSASAGFLMTIAADVAAMAPGRHIGAAHPVAGGGEKLDETMANKTAQDAAAHARSLAEHRKRNVVLAEEAVTKSRSFTESEALKASPPLIDVVASSFDDLLKQLDGRTITRFDGSTVTLRTSGATAERIAMSWRQRLLSAIAHPQVAYLLLSIGTLGLTIELWNPGAALPGVVGGLCLLRRCWIDFQFFEAADRSSLSFLSPLHRRICNGRIEERHYWK